MDVYFTYIITQIDHCAKTLLPAVDICAVPKRQMFFQLMCRHTHVQHHWAIPATQSNFSSGTRPSSSKVTFVKSIISSRAAPHTAGATDGPSVIETCSESLFEDLLCLEQRCRMEVTLVVLWRFDDREAREDRPFILVSIQRESRRPKELLGQCCRAKHCEDPEQEEWTVACADDCACGLNENLVV